jgi:hypothetical protein
MPVKDVAEMSIKDVEDFDAKWYSKISGLWMDLIGDYAGTELFVLDGSYRVWSESYIQTELSIHRRCCLPICTGRPTTSLRANQR